MEILYHGNLKTGKTTFICPYCGCIFQAEESEYRVRERLLATKEKICQCPDCGSVIAEGSRSI